jgi:hypothetical protein
LIENEEKKAIPLPNYARNLTQNTIYSIVLILKTLDMGVFDLNEPKQSNSRKLIKSVINKLNMVGWALELIATYRNCFSFVTNSYEDDMVKHVIYDRDSNKFIKMTCDSTENASDVVTFIESYRHASKTI